MAKIEKRGYQPSREGKPLTEGYQPKLRPTITNIKPPPPPPSQKPPEKS